VSPDYDSDTDVSATFDLDSFPFADDDVTFESILDASLEYEAEYGPIEYGPMGWAFETVMQ